MALPPDYPTDDDDMFCLKESGHQKKNEPRFGVALLRSLATDDFIVAAETRTKIVEQTWNIDEASRLHFEPFLCSEDRRRRQQCDFNCSGEENSAEEDGLQSCDEKIDENTTEEETQAPKDDNCKDGK